ncbi:unnamed protein product [Rotaria socialis]|uniref:Uncharacterized protein n=2 Tax=Rotaria socialis TaxID=392032 RepID=A0A818IJD6_9BILA|nr:unnamed protein product [Rotaria socialis]
MTVNGSHKTVNTLAIVTEIKAKPKHESSPVLSSNHKTASEERTVQITSSTGNSSLSSASQAQEPIEICQLLPRSEKPWVKLIILSKCTNSNKTALIEKDINSDINNQMNNYKNPQDDEVAIFYQAKTKIFLRLYSFCLLKKVTTLRFGQCVRPLTR